MDKSKLKDYFNGRLASDEESKVRLWLSKNADDPILSEVMSELFDNELSDHSQDAIMESDGKAAFANVAGKLGIAEADLKKRNIDFRTIVRWTVRIAACLFIPLAFSLAFLLNGRKDLISAAQWKEVEVPYGDTSNLRLSDGTVLHLNSGTRVTYPTAFPGKERKVYVDGEILAEVAHNSKKPFIIHSGHVDVRVLGTKFNFKSYQGSSIVEVFLINGSVSFDISSHNGNDHRQIRMSPGELIQYDKQTENILLNKFSPDNYKSFTDGGAIHFFNLKLTDIVDDLERHFGKKIVIMDETISQRRYFALFSNGEGLDEILSCLSGAKKMTISHRDGVIYLSK